MEMRKMLAILIVLSQLIPKTIISAPDFFYQKCSNDVGNYTNSSPFKKNLDTVLNSISTNSQSDKGFYATFGEEPNRATAMALCRGPVPSEDCRNCVKNSTQMISQTCPNQKEAAGWYHDCQILYSNRSIQGVGDIRPKIFYMNTGKASDPSGFNQALGRLLDELRVQLTETGTPTLKSVFGVKAVPKSNTNIYGLFDCFPDLSLTDCDRCFTHLQSYLPVCCNASIGARLMAGSCQLNYEINPIYAALLPPPPLSTAAPPPLTPSFDDIPLLSLPPTQTQGVGNNNSTRRIFIIVFSSTISVSIFISLILLFFLRKRKRNQKAKMIFKTVDQSTNEIISIEMLQFDFETIKLGTNEFSSENKIGQGGFGAVYKGKLPDGREIAVKRLAKDSQQGEAEFRNEVLLVAKLHHRNLVRLLGFCLQKNERLLIYEFVQNASLDHFIFDFESQLH